MYVIGSQNKQFDHLHSFIALATLSALLLGVLLSQFAPTETVFGSIALVLACIAISLEWPHGALLVLVAASVMPHVVVDVGGWNARPEHCSVLLVLVALLFRWLTGKNLKIAFDRSDFCVIAYIVWNYVSSGLMSPDPKLTLRWALLNNLAVLAYFLMRILITDEHTLRWVFKVFLTVATLECAYAIICFASQLFWGTSFGIEVGQYSGGYGGVYGTQFEPNLLGSFAGCTAIMLVVAYFISRKRSLWLLAGIVTSVAGLVVSLSRAALLGFLFASVVLLAVGFLTRRVRLIQLLPIILGGALLLTPIALTGGRNLLERLGNLSGGVQDDMETMARVVSWTSALEDIAQHPVMGNGTASFQLLSDAKQFSLLGGRPWIGNSVIRVLHDTGLIGFLLMMSILVSLSIKAKAAIANHRFANDGIVVLIAGLLVYAVAFMSTEGTMLAFFWVHLGLLRAVCSLDSAAVL
jgi:O-antigen ligase